MSEKIEAGDTVLVKLGGNGFWCEGEVLKVGDDGRAFVAESTGPELWRPEGDYLLLRKAPKKALDSRGVEIRVGGTVIHRSFLGIHAVTGVTENSVRLGVIGLSFNASSLTVVILPTQDDDR